jgi:hypothetical protein
MATRPRPRRGAFFMRFLPGLSCGEIVFWRRFVIVRMIAVSDHAITDEFSSQPVKRSLDRSGAMARSGLQMPHIDKFCDHRRRRNRSLEADYPAHCDTANSSRQPLP